MTILFTTTPLDFSNESSLIPCFESLHTFLGNNHPEFDSEECILIRGQLFTYFSVTSWCDIAHRFFCKYFSVPNRSKYFYLLTLGLCEQFLFLAVKSNEYYDIPSDLDPYHFVFIVFIADLISSIERNSISISSNFLTFSLCDSASIILQSFISTVISLESTPGTLLFLANVPKAKPLVSHLTSLVSSKGATSPHVVKPRNPFVVQTLLAEERRNKNGDTYEDLDDFIEPTPEKKRKRRTRLD
ncbi:hypothetical protein RCL1_006731 [Eukaryota sp. TZLM3-RCL]